MCDPLNLCNQLDINDRCSTSIPQLSGLRGCCCGSNTCNLDYSTTLPPPDNTTYTPMLCYVGVKIGSLDARTDLSVCYGVCASLTIMATIGDNTINATIYACETKSVCSNFGVQNRCQQVPATVLGANIFGCCCTDNLCNDPNGPPVVVTPSPSTSLQCYAGFTVLKGPNDYYTAGDTLQCNGQCANLTLAVGTSYFTFLMCDPYELCSRLGIVDRCR